MSATSVRTIANESLGWSIGLSVLMILAGLLAIALPQVAGFTVSILVGWLLILSGVAHLVFGWATRSVGSGLIWELCLGLLYVGIGFYVWLHPLAGLAALTLFLAAYLFVEGVLELIMSFAVRGLAGSWWLLFDGIITLILAILIWRAWPSSSEWVIGTLVGISMLFSGVTRLMISMAARNAVA